MNNIDEIVDKLKTGSDAIKDAFKLSYDCLSDNPNSKQEIVEQWSKYIGDFLKYTVEVSDNGKNNELSKAITKIFMFGRL